jgi:hypothetical protein
MTRSSQSASSNPSGPEMPQSSPLKVAPLFELPTPIGEIRTLDSFLEKARLLLVFHRGTW